MADELTPEQQLAFDETIASVQRIAMRIVAMPKENREHAYAITRRNFEEAAQKLGMPGAADRWLHLTMQSLRALVEEIEAGGGAPGGTA